jgi:hypothetical protein
MPNFTHLYFYLIYQIGALQNKIRDSQVSNHDHHEVLKSELGRRDETIQKLRKDMLHFQEKRDAYQTEVIPHCHYVHFLFITQLPTYFI